MATVESRGLTGETTPDLASTRAAYQSPSGCRFTTRVRLRIMNRPDGFSATASLNGARDCEVAADRQRRVAVVLEPLLDLVVEAVQPVILHHAISARSPSRVRLRIDEAPGTLGHIYNTCEVQGVTPNGCRHHPIGGCAGF